MTASAEEADTCRAFTVTHAVGDGLEMKVYVCVFQLFQTGSQSGKNIYQSPGFHVATIVSTLYAVTPDKNKQRRNRSIHTYIAVMVS